MTHRYKYSSENGYSGELYGLSSLSIRNAEGREVLHTGKRNIETYEELAAFVEGFPEFYKALTAPEERGDA